MGSLLSLTSDLWAGISSAYVYMKPALFVDPITETSCFTCIWICSYFTPDTYANEHSALAARLAAGLCADLASAVISGGAKNGFALVIMHKYCWWNFKWSICDTYILTVSNLSKNVLGSPSWPSCWCERGHGVLPSQQRCNCCISCTSSRS